MLRIKFNITCQTMLKGKTGAYSLGIMGQSPTLHIQSVTGLHRVHLCNTSHIGTPHPHCPWTVEMVSASLQPSLNYLPLRPE